MKKSYRLIHRILNHELFSFEILNYLEIEP